MLYDSIPLLPDTREVLFSQQRSEKKQNVHLHILDVNSIRENTVDEVMESFFWIGSGLRAGTHTLALIENPLEK